jgi:histidine triad (HIT) family protein
MVADCLFCRIVAGDVPAQRIAEDERTIAFLDIAPAAPGHALVIPRRHATDLLDAPEDDAAACMGTAQRVAHRQRDVLGATGVNLFQSNGRDAGQTVFHLHLHVIPRTRGDGLVHPWTPRPSDPDELADLARRLRG